MIRSRNRSRVRDRGVQYTRNIATVIPSVVFDLDATQPSSYPGSGQSWNNLVQNPADGSARSAYNFWLGLDATVTTNDPTFTGPQATSQAYFACDGDDQTIIQSNANAFIQNTFRTDLTNEWWVAIAFQLGTIGVSQNLAGNSNGSTVRGWRFDVNATNSLRFTRADGVTSVSTTFAGTLAASTPYLFVMTYKNDTLAINSAINSRTFTNTTGAVLANTVANAGEMAFGSARTSTTRIAAGGRLYGISMGNTGLTNAQLSALVDFYNRRHGRVYA